MIGKKYALKERISWSFVIKSITIRHGSEVDAIQAEYLLSDGTTYPADKHGGNGGKPTTIPFEAGEKIIAIVGRSGDRVDQLNFLTMTEAGGHKTHGPYGGNGGNQFILNAEVLGFFGRSGSRLDAIGFYTANPPSPDITIYGSKGYRYCILQSADEKNTCTVPVQDGATDLSFRLNFLGDNNRGVGFTVTAPDRTRYSSSSQGKGGVWAVAAKEQNLGLQTFYIQNPQAGSWTASVSTSIDVEWSLIGSTNPENSSRIAQDAFSQLSPSERESIYNALAPLGTEIPREVCYFCQAQAVTIMGLAVATFVFWAGPVIATSAVVLYAQRLLPVKAATLVSIINDLYGYWQKGTTSWNLARRFCELEGMCPNENS